MNEELFLALSDRMCQLAAGGVPEGSPGPGAPKGGAPAISIGAATRAMWGFAMLVRRFLRPAAHAAACLGGMRSIRAFVLSVWMVWLPSSFAQGLHDDPVISQLVPHALATLPHARPADVAAILWALTASGHSRDDDRLVEACLAHAARHAR